MSNAVLIAPTATCALACLVLVLAEYKKWALVRTLSKTIASVAFINVGVLAGMTTDYDRFIVAGLVLGAVGDIALLGKSDRAFLAGLAAFLLGHLAYVVAAAKLVPPADWLQAAGMIAIAPAVVGVVVLAWLWPRLGARPARHAGDKPAPSMRVPVIAYVATIIAMVIGALATHVQLFAVGAVLFFASDLAVARDKFVAPGFVNRAWGLPCYYAAQLIIAWSLA